MPVEKLKRFILTREAKLFLFNFQEEASDTDVPTEEEKQTRCYF